MKHTKISASNLYRVMNCTKSAELCAVMPEQIESVFATQGTDDHKILTDTMAIWFEDIKGQSTYKDFEGNVPPHMQSNVFEMVDYVNQLVAHHGPLLDYRIEHKMTCLDITGTGDFLLKFAHGIVYAIDYKSGAGVKVEVETNPQLAFYAIGASKEWPETEKVYAVIFQPNIEDDVSSFSHWELNKETLESWSFAISTCLDVIKNKQTVFITGDYCGWCPALALCPKKKEALEGITKYKISNHLQPSLPLPQSMTVKELETVMLYKEQISEWLKAVSKQAYNFAINGYTFDQLKLVEGRRQRKWDATVQNLPQEIESLIKSDPYNHKLKTLTEVEKVIGKNKLSHLTIKPAGALKLVPRSDKRLEVNTMEIAISEFSEDVEPEFENI